MTKPQAESLGRKRRKRFLQSLPALAALTDRARELTKERHYFYSLDKQRLPSPSSHTALNTLLQAAGSVLVKRAMVLAYDGLRSAGIRFRQVGWCHDEMQYLMHPDDVETARPILLQAFLDAGVYYGFRIPTPGEVKVGKNWNECH